MKLEKIKKFENCRLSNSVINNILGGVVMDVPQLMQVQLQTRIVTAQCVIVLTRDMGYKRSYGTLAYTHNWGIKDDASIYMNVVDC